jgi:hypothetical protein
MTQTEFDAKVLDILRPYSSLDFDSLKEQFFRDGSYSYAREAALKATLSALADKGTIKAGGAFGPFELLVRTKPAGGKHAKQHPRLSGR